ncbi:MAG: trimeric intracellular cation channel family protein [Flavobacteriaceae bacterium]
MDFDVFISVLSYLGTLSFAISGFITASKKQLDLFGAFVIAFVTGLGGGTLRDFLCDEIPLTFRREIYATACILGAVSYLGFEALGFGLVLKTTLACSIIILIRTLAVLKNWSIPVVADDSE